MRIRGNPNPSAVSLSKAAPTCMKISNNAFRKRGRVVRAPASRGEENWMSFRSFLFRCFNNVNIPYSVLHILPQVMNFQYFTFYPKLWIPDEKFQTLVLQILDDKYDKRVSGRSDKFLLRATESWAAAQCRQPAGISLPKRTSFWVWERRLPRMLIASFFFSVRAL